MLINSYNVISSRSKVIIYADDLSIIHHVPTSLSDDSQFEINNLVSWASDNKLFINPIKTFVMNINPKNHFIPPLFLCDKIIKTSTSLKLLGITFTNDLKFNNHFTAIIKKCSYGMAAVTKLYHSGIRGKTLYLALVFSQFAYCLPVICDIPQHCFTKPLFNSHQFAFIPHDYLGTTNALTVFHLHILNCIIYTCSCQRLSQSF